MILQRKIQGLDSEILDVKESKLREARKEEKVNFQTRIQKEVLKNVHKRNRSTIEHKDAENSFREFPKAGSSLNVNTSSEYLSFPLISPRNQTIIQSPIIKGNNIEQMLKNKEVNLNAHKQQIEELKKENEQIKQLNSKLIEKIDHLQLIVDKEASAKDYYYNYPPKPESQLIKESQAIITGHQSEMKQQDKISKQAQQKQMLQHEFEEKLQKELRIQESNHIELKRGQALELDELYQILSDSFKSSVKLSNEYKTLDKKFKNYYDLSEEFMKETNNKIKSLNDTISKLTQQLNKYTKLYNEESRHREELEEQSQTQQQLIEQLNTKNTQLNKQVLYYEDKYKFIDIGKLHEKVQFLETKLKVTETRSSQLEKELYDFRDKIMRATQKSSSFQYTDAKKKGGFLKDEEKEKEQKNQKEEKKKYYKQNWQGGEQVEESTRVLLNYLQNEVTKSIQKTSYMIDWKRRDSHMLDSENENRTK